MRLLLLLLPLVPRAGGSKSLVEVTAEINLSFSVSLAVLSWKTAKTREREREADNDICSYQQKQQQQSYQPLANMFADTYTGAHAYI